MTKEDIMEVIDIVKEASNIIADRLGKTFEHVIENQDKKIDSLRLEIDLMRKDFKQAMQDQINTIKQAMQEQTSIFLKVLNAYEKKQEEHEQKFKKMRDSLS